MYSSVTGRVEFTFHIQILGPSELCAHKHSHDNINNDNDYKSVDVKSENATENNAEVEEVFEDDTS